MIMNFKFKPVYLLFIVFVSTSSVAVQLNHKGLGEVLIYPYYTVNNNLNTLYSVVNTTADTKAIRVRFLEGDIGIEMSVFNIYLSAFDVWTGALIPGTSTISGHLGEPSVIHLTSDTSCAPFLVKSGQEFFSFELDTDLDFDNRSMERSRQGYIEVIEMATFNGWTIPAADHGTVGVPSDCAAIEADWTDNGIYDTFADEQAPTGGIFGTATLVNVAEGLAFSYDAIALQNFWQGGLMHTEPGSLEPNLNSAFPRSTVLLDNGELNRSEWTQGFQAVSSVLSKYQLINEYAIDGIILGKTEWVMTFPTKRFHTNNSDQNLLRPFSQAWNGTTSCDEYQLNVYDREEQIEFVDGNGGPFPQLPLPQFCLSANVFEFLPPDMSISDSSSILGSNSHYTITTSSNAFTESGWGRLEFLDTVTPLPVSGSGLKGLPVTGFAVQQYTNAGAAEGLLAQYGSLFMHKGLVVTDDEVVD